MQIAEVIIPPWNIDNLQRKALQRYFHGLNVETTAWILVVLYSTCALSSAFNRHSCVKPVGMTGMYTLNPA